MTDPTPGSTPTPAPTPVESRLVRIEETLAALAAELSAIRGELGSPAAATPPLPRPAERPAQQRRPIPPPPPPRPAKAPSRSFEVQDLETLFGRYGMLAIGVLAAVFAVGTFLRWAIVHGYFRLGPGARVLIGLAAANGLALWGLRLRRRERSFGSSILGLALVITLVCAYAAGPGFDLVPTWVAFAGAALVSWALAIFAHAENDEPLWCVAFGGAALAPFVTSDGHGSVFMLLGYGALVLLPACFAISHRDWRIAWSVFYGVSALFTIAGVAGARGEPPSVFIAAFAFPFVIITAGLVPFAPESRKRASIRWLGVLAVLVTIAQHAVTRDDRWLIAGVFMAGLALWLFLLDRQAYLPQSSLLEVGRDNPRGLDWIDAAGIPLMLVLQAGETLGPGLERWPLFAAAAAIFVAFAWRRAVNSLRDASAFGAVAAGFAVVATLPLEDPLGRISAFVALGLISLVSHKARPSVSWLAMGVGITLFAAVMSVIALTERAAYTFTPFMTEPSLTAVVVLLGLIIVARFWYWLRTSTRAAMGERPEWTYAASLRQIVRGAAVAPWIWAFFWVLIELSMAYSPSTSTLLLVTYFAATGAGCVWAGRERHSARLRQIGLGLAFAAAGTAFYGASSYLDFGMRIAAYLVTSAFLLGIAYWYRQPGSGTREEVRV